MGQSELGQALFFNNAPGGILKNFWDGTVQITKWNHIHFMLLIWSAAGFLQVTESIKIYNLFSILALENNDKFLRSEIVFITVI